VREPPDSGLVAGYAAGVMHASHPLLFFCNEDLYLGPSCLRDLARSIDLDQRVAAADPWQWTYDGSEWIHGGVRFRRSMWDFNSPLPFRRHNFVAPLPDGARIPFGCAGAVMVHADVYKGIGGWDTSFFLDYEDVDFFLRAWQRGWVCVTVPSARIYHAVGASNDKVVGARPQSVSRRRYVANRSNVTVVALKHFSPRLATIGLAMWLITLLMDLLVLRDIRRRVPAILSFRRSNRVWNRAKPAERFFLAPEFAESRR
jgi:GT2 family glycosyltransferase